MLHEMKNVAQKEDHVFRRWFEDEYFDLIVWYDANNREITGFQLCYDRQMNEHAFTWENPGWFSHNKIDNTRGAMGHPATPILVADGIFPFSQLIGRFRQSSAFLDEAIVNLVIEKITEYAGSKR